MSSFYHFILKKLYFAIPAETTHSEMSPDEREKAQITPGLLRISCGTEPNLVEKMREVLQEISDRKKESVAAEK